MDPLAAVSLFDSNYKNGDYEFALRFGRWLVCAKPMTLEGRSSFNLQSRFNKLIDTYESIGKTKEDPAIRSAYLDSALAIYDISLDLFGEDKGERFDLILKKGRFYQTNYDYIEDGLGKAYQSYQEAIKLDPEKAISLGEGYYMNITLDYLVSKGEKERAQELIDLLMPHASGKNLDFLNEQQKELLGSPTERLEYYLEVLENEPNDLEALNAIADAHAQLDNREELAKVRKKIHEINPTYESAVELAEIESGNANYAAAIDYLKQALAKATTDDQRIELNMKLANNTFNQDNLQTARNYIREVLNLDSNNGRAYIKLADIYARAVTNCSEDRKLEAEDRTVYWLVVDYLNKAKRIDSSVSNAANSKLSAYEPVTPTTDDRFLTLNLEKGEKVKIDGSLMPCYSWINETTTAR
ncbi:MAG: hypothetical protein FH748_11415 [Balneolaceae bacterium]|nr:hypothetical protein [Balneolaceae bacterium]